MTTTAKTTRIPQVEVFGRRPPGGIYNPASAFAVRNDCKSGFWKLGQTQRLNGQLMRMSRERSDFCVRVLNVNK
jgi:hypothetical protein